MTESKTTKVVIQKPVGKKVLVQHTPTGNLSRLNNYSDESAKKYAAKKLGVDASELKIFNSDKTFEKEYVKMKMAQMEASTS